MDWVESTESNVTNENSLDLSNNQHQNSDIMLQNDEFHNLNTQFEDPHLNLNLTQLNQLINLNNHDDLILNTNSNNDKTDEKNRNDNNDDNLRQLILNSNSPHRNGEETIHNNEDNSQNIDLSNNDFLTLFE